MRRENYRNGAEALAKRVKRVAKILLTLANTSMSITLLWYFDPKPGKARGGGSNRAASQTIAHHFSQDHARVLKLLSKSPFWHILSECPENVWSLTKIFKFFEAKIINFDLFQNFDKQNFKF